VNCLQHLQSKLKAVRIELAQQNYGIAREATYEISWRIEYAADDEAGSGYAGEAAKGDG
jgi:hypothetical protein